MSTILFYRINDPYGEFSNFAPFPIKLDGKTWPTSEHYFQAQKFADMKDKEEIRKAKGPMDAARMGRDRNRTLRRDWDRVKDNVMYEVVKAKFIQHTALRELLISTGDTKLIEHTENDRYWADGGDGSGQNMLGLILMRLRAEFAKGQF
jgi:N-glycosidase YbiA